MWHRSFVEIEECGYSSKASIIKVRFLNSPPVEFGVVKRFPDFRSVHEKEAKLAEKSALLHPSFVNYYGCFQRGSHYNIVMELCSKGSVMDEISRRSKTREFWGEEALLDITLKLFEAMAALHKAKHIHGDLKPDNLFVTDHDEVKIGDLGSGKSFVNTLEEATLRGTLAYLPPELVKAKFYGRHYLKMSLTRADVWCMGRTVYEMAVLRKMRNLNIEDQEQLDDALMRTLTQRTDYSVAFCELLVKMHRVDPSERPRFSELIPELKVQKLRSDMMLYDEDRDISLESQQLGNESYTETEQEDQFIVSTTLANDSISATEVIDYIKSFALSLAFNKGEEDRQPTISCSSIASTELKAWSTFSNSPDFISLPCSHPLHLSCIESHLRKRASLDTLKCPQCQRNVPYEFLKGLTNSYIGQALEAHFAVQMKSRCPACQKVHSVKQLDKVYLAVTVTCSCSTRFCSLCYKSPPHRSMCRVVKRLD
jgi:NIMA (never in mitosis gene a)-related kinase